MGLLEEIYAHRSAGNDTALLELLKDPSVQHRAGLRNDIASALGEIGGPRAATALAGMFDDPVRRVRRTAIAESGNTRDPRLLGPLATKLDSEEKLERVWAAKSLGQLEGGVGIPVLLEHAVDDPESMVRLYAINALGTAMAREAVPALLKALHDPSGAVRVAAAVAPPRSQVRAGAGELLEQRELVEATEDPPRDRT